MICTTSYLYLCDREKRVKEGYCNGIGCLMRVCYLTSNKRYARTLKMKIRGKWKGVKLSKNKLVM